MVPAALRLARQSGLSTEDTRLLEVAAIFHDVGFLEVSHGNRHEQASLKVVREVLPDGTLQTTAAVGGVPVEGAYRL